MHEHICSCCIVLLWEPAGMLAQVLDELIAPLCLTICRLEWFGTSLNHGILMAATHLSAPSALSFWRAERALSGVCLLKVATLMYPIFPELSTSGVPGALTSVLLLAWPHSCDVTGLILIFSRFRTISLVSC